MAIDTLETPIGQSEFFAPEDAEGFERFIREELADRLVEVPLQEVEQEKILWRGHNPHEIAGLLSGHLPEISLDHQYVTLHKDRAITYNRGGQGVHYNIAVGFMPPDDWKSQPAQEKISDDLKHSKTILQYQVGNFEATGHIQPADVRFVAIRPHGGAGKVPGPVKYYRVLG